MHPPGLCGRWSLIGRASAAHRALTAAAASLNETVLPATNLTGETGQIALVDDRIVTDWWETLEPAIRTRRPEDEASARHRPSFGRSIDL